MIVWARNSLSRKSCNHSSFSWAFDDSGPYTGGQLTNADEVDYAWMRSELGSYSGRNDGRAAMATPATSIE